MKERNPGTLENHADSGNASRKRLSAFRNVYVSKVKAENVDEFISASGWNDSLRLENFYLYAIEAQTDKPGKICYTKNFNLSEITLKTEERMSLN